MLQFVLMLLLLSWKHFSVGQALVNQKKVPFTARDDEASLKTG